MAGADLHLHPLACMQSGLVMVSRGCAIDQLVQSNVGRAQTLVHLDMDRAGENVHINIVQSCSAEQVMRAGIAH